jgi:hypothetical protein
MSDGMSNYQDKQIQRQSRTLWAKNLSKGD